MSADVLSRFNAIVSIQRPTPGQDASGQPVEPMTTVLTGVNCGVYQNATNLEGPAYSGDRDINSGNAYFLWDQGGLIYTDDQIIWGSRTLRVKGRTPQYDDVGMPTHWLFAWEETL